MKLFHDLLEAHGYGTVGTRNGIEALDLARKHRPDLILMDIQLPEVSGLEVTKWLKDDPELQAIPVVAVTAFAMKGDEERIREGGCEAYLSKPISVPKFLDTIRRFFVKFVEVSAAGLATAISAYALAHFGGLLSSSPTPASAPAQTAVQVGPTASEVAGSLRGEPAPPAAAAAVNKQSPAPQQDTDAPVAQPARKAVKDAKALPPRQRTKTDTSVAEKEPRGQKSAEALARAALANVDANRPAPNDARIEPRLT